MKCIAFGCNNDHTKEGISFHKFPLNEPARLKEWLQRVKRVTSVGKPWTPSKHSRLCSEHFTENSFEVNYGERLLGARYGKRCKQLNSDAIPNKFMHRPTPKSRPHTEQRLKRKHESDEQVSASCLSSSFTYFFKQIDMNRIPTYFIYL